VDADLQGAFAWREYRPVRVSHVCDTKKCHSQAPGVVPGSTTTTTTTAGSQCLSEHHPAGQRWRSQWCLGLITRVRGWGTVLGVGMVEGNFRVQKVTAGRARHRAGIRQCLLMCVLKKRQQNPRRRTDQPPSHRASEHRKSEDRSRGEPQQAAKLETADQPSRGKQSRAASRDLQHQSTTV